MNATTLEKLLPRAVKVTEAAANVERAEAVPSLAREEVDVGEGWRVVGGKVVRRVEVVSWLSGPIGCARSAGLSEVVEKVQALIRSGFQTWGISAKVWGAHGSDEILWTVSGVGEGVRDAEVVDRWRVIVEASVGTEEVVC